MTDSNTETSTDDVTIHELLGDADIDGSEILETALLASGLLLVGAGIGMVVLAYQFNAAVCASTPLVAKTCQPAIASTTRSTAQPAVLAGGAFLLTYGVYGLLWGDDE